jgi:hypothetical protein
MEQADFAMTDMAMASMGQKSESQERILVRFFMHPHPDAEASAAEGRPIFKEREYIQIMVPGDKNNIPTRPVWEADKARFPQAYAAFKNGTTEKIVGTPLTAVGWLSKAQIEELAYFHVRSLEQLADIADSNAQKFMGINAMRQRARDFIAAAKESAPLLALRTEVEKKDNEIASLLAALKEQNLRIAALEKSAA